MTTDLLGVLSIFPRLVLVWADAGYTCKLVEWVEAVCGWILEIVKRNDDIKGFHVLPHRWVVERTFGWLNRYRRLRRLRRFNRIQRSNDICCYDSLNG
jgi:putative transposase